jgi:hypothetical protein
LPAESIVHCTIEQRRFVLIKGIRDSATHTQRAREKNDDTYETAREGAHGLRVIDEYFL